MANKFQCEIITLEAIYDLCGKLSMQIRESGFKIDLVVAIARGGYVPARLVCDFLHLHQLTSLKVEHYMGTEMGEKAVLKYPLNANVKGLNVLLVDDVNDTGKSIQTARDHLISQGAAEVRVAVMHEKRGSLLETDYHVGFLDTWRWLIYEWAVIEDVGGFIEKSGLTKSAEILEMLKADYGISWTAADLEKIRPFLRTTID